MKGPKGISLVGLGISLLGLNMVDLKLVRLNRQACIAASVAVCPMIRALGGMLSIHLKARSLPAPIARIPDVIHQSQIVSSQLFSWVQQHNNLCNHEVHNYQLVLP